MAVEYRKQRKKWGFRVYRAGHRYAKYAWDTKTDARQAEREFLVDLKTQTRIPKNTLTQVVSAYFVESARKGRSEWRLDGLHWTFAKWILPHFGENRVITTIRPKDVEEFILHHKARRVVNKTIWNYVTDLRAMFNWAVKEGLARENPVHKADLDPIRNRRSKKPPLNLENVERAADALCGAERVYFDFLRYTGLRKDEANRTRWDDIDFDRGWLHVAGTKTEESDNYMPLAPMLRQELSWLYENRQGSEYVFPGHSKQTVGKKIYSRRKLFEKIERLTSSCAHCGENKIGKRRYCRDCKTIEPISRIHRCSKCKSVNVNEGIGCRACGSSKINPGVKLRPKDMRDYFASEVAARVNDPNVVMRLLRHTSLVTTTKYLRTVKDRMQDAVSGLEVW
jgi:integrase